MLKKIVFLLLACALLFSGCSKESFYVYGEDTDKVAKVLDLSESDLQKYCKENGITYLAVNPDNTKQIKKSETVDGFSKRVVDFAVLQDDEILALSGELSTFKDVKGEVVSYEGLKFLKFELKTTDSGGEYVLTQYITVNNSKKIILTFYTAASADRDYIEDVFKEQFAPQTDYKPYVIIGIVLFSLAAIVTAVFIIKELKNKETD